MSGVGRHEPLGRLQAVSRFTALVLRLLHSSRAFFPDSKARVNTDKCASVRHFNCTQSSEKDLQTTSFVRPTACARLWLIGQRSSQLSVGASCWLSGFCSSCCAAGDFYNRRLKLVSGVWRRTSVRKHIARARSFDAQRRSYLCARAPEFVGLHYGL